MPGTGPQGWITIGADTFPVRLERNLAPASCARLQALAPLGVELIHARWSGEACWAPLAAAWPSGLLLPEESATATPSPGQILLYAGPLSEPELLIPYGPTRFACSAGALAGNPVMTIEDGLGRLEELGRQILWGGAMKLRIDLTGATA
jgi:hypothetical protein